MKKFKYVAIFFILLFINLSPITAIYDPLSRPNNQYGIHLADINDLSEAAKLVNSTGGDWGYVTIVITEAERNSEQWNVVFNQMRRTHVIPLIRVATKSAGDTWIQPQTSTIQDWVTFFENLKWPTENRYIILFNEPNHAKEWGGTIDPAGYAQTVIDFAKSLKEASEKYFILPAGLDASAGSGSQTMDAGVFLRQAVLAQPLFLTVLDGWTSHSYPNPGFSASPNGRGKGSIRSFEWELMQLKELGLKKDLPVFITETGWSHSSSVLSPGRLSPAQVSEYIDTAAQDVWQDRRIAAVTPFVFSYQSYPFDQFSWKKLGSDDYYPHYFAYYSLPKERGYPIQQNEFIVTKQIIPSLLVANSTYTFTGSVKNTGQSILDPRDGWKLTVDDRTGSMITFAEEVPYLEPNETGTFTLHLQTPKQTGMYPIELQLTHGPDTLTIEKLDVTLFPPPGLRIQTQLGWKKSSNIQEVTVLVYGDDESLLHRFTGLIMKNGVVEVAGLTNIIPDQKYRVVMLVPNYLPRQVIAYLSKEETTLTMKRFLALDISGDGAFTVDDVLRFIQVKPATIISRFFGP